MSNEQIMEIEESFWENSGDQGFYEDHVADNGRFVLSMGVMDKDEVVASMADADPWESFEIHDPTQVEINDGVVGLVYEGTGRRDAGSDDYRANILSVYKKTGDQWQLILHQQTPIDSS